MPKTKDATPTGFVSANIRANFWKPEKDGESIRGWYQGSRVIEKRDNFPEQTVYEVADENGELLVLTGVVLARQFERVEVGDEVFIVYHGRVKSKAGKAPMKSFDVMVKGELKPFARNN